MEYRKIFEIEFREFTRDVLEISRKWLSDPQIKAQTLTPDIDLEVQERWFQSLSTRKDYFIRSVWLKGIPIGVTGLKHLTDKEGETFGYIGEKEYWGKAIGIQGMEYLINYARSIHLESLYSVILKENVSSYKLNRRMGFLKEKDIDERTIMMRLYL